MSLLASARYNGGLIRSPWLRTIFFMLCWQRSVLEAQPYAECRHLYLLPTVAHKDMLQIKTLLQIKNSCCKLNKWQESMRAH